MSDFHDRKAEQRAAESDARKRRALEMIDLRGLLEDKRFRDFMVRGLDFCGVATVTLHGNSKDVLATGMRNAGNWFLSELLAADKPAALDIFGSLYPSYVEPTDGRRRDC